MGYTEKADCDFNRYNQNGFECPVLFEDIPYNAIYSWEKDVIIFSTKAVKNQSDENIIVMDAISLHEDLHRRYLSLKEEEQRFLNNSLINEISNNSGFRNAFLLFIDSYFQMEDTDILYLYQSIRIMKKSESDGIGCKDLREINVKIDDEIYTVYLGKLFTEFLSYGLMCPNEKFLKDYLRYSVKSTLPTQYAYQAIQESSVFLKNVLNHSSFLNRKIPNWRLYF